MTTQQNIIAAIDAFQSRSSMSDRALSLAVTSDPTLVARLRRGTGSLRMIGKIEDYIAAWRSSSETGS